MGLRTWIARNTQTPADYARVYASHLIELIEYLAVDLVAFSGRRTVGDENESHPIVFENHFEMELSGFVSPSKTEEVLVEPNPAAMRAEQLYPAAFRDSVAFLSLLADYMARKYMRPQNAEIFTKSLHVSVAQRCAGKYGLPLEPRDTFLMIQELIPTFLCKQMLNVDSYGSGDGLGNILKHLSVSGGSKVRYGFVTGSGKQRLGCARAYLTVLTNISETIESCAKEMQW